MGQPRIWMSMSRDGLLPKKFSSTPKIQNTILCNSGNQFVVAVPALFLNLTMVTDLCSIGTLFAFVLVCARFFSLAKQNGYSEENSKHIM
jgi:amino acid transporter